MSAETLSQGIFEISSGQSGEKFHFSPDLEQALIDDDQPDLYKHTTVIETTAKRDEILDSRAFISAVLPDNIYPSAREIQSQGWTGVRLLLRYTSIESPQIEEIKYRYYTSVVQEIAAQVGTYACLTVAAPLQHPTTTAGCRILGKAASIDKWLIRPPHLYAMVDSEGKQILFADSYPYTAQVDEEDEAIYRYLDKPEPEDGPQADDLIVSLDSAIIPTQEWKQIEKLYEEFELEAVRSLVIA
jgi:hypothetical protein